LDHAVCAKEIACPQCGKPSAYRTDNLFRPFCSERCKLADLGAWANEEYRVEVKSTDQEQDSESPPES
jgi:endogenous inhibitor of DNA gyrase (YacG/DUF329 family)